MQDDYSCQTPRPTSDQSEWKEDNLRDSEDENRVSEPSATEISFRSVMSQREMEILTALFPKSAHTLAGVLRNRPQRLENES
jgi:hypothetical protein